MPTWRGDWLLRCTRRTLAPGPDRAVSSAAEHCFHTAGVSGSNPLPPTTGTRGTGQRGVTAEVAMSSLSSSIHSNSVFDITAATSS